MRDTAIVNVPLSKRGDLAAMAARSVREERAAENARHKAARAEHRKLVARAINMVAQVSADRMAEMGRAHGLTAKQTRAEFVAAARSRPAQVIKAMTRELAPSVTEVAA